MRSLWLGAVVSLLGGLVSTPALAADAPPAPAKPVWKPAPKKPAPPALPAPSVALELEAPAQGPVFTMRLKNNGPAPLRVVTDPRLLRVTLPPNAAVAPAAKGKKAPKPTVCALPAANRPSGDGDARVLPPGKTYVQKLDIRTLCFSADATAALESATRISAAYGFESKSLLPPFVVSPLDPTEAEPTPTLASAKDVQMAERDLGAHSLTPKPAPATSTSPTAPASTPAPAGLPHDADIGLPRLTLVSTPRLDADDAEYATLTATLKNESSRAVSLALRPFVLVLDVTSPSGKTAQCSVAGNTALSRDLLATLGPGRAASLSVALGRFCNQGTFDERGIYSVLAHIDTRKTAVSGRSDGIFSGEIAATAPTLVRVRTGALPPVADWKPKID